MALRISAGERYRFFVDGEEAGVGPERGDADHWRMDGWHVSLQSGSHWLGLEVWALGSDAPLWQVPVPPGLLVIADPPHADQVSSGLGSWECLPIQGIQFAAQPDAFFTGPRAVVDGTRYPWGWATGEGDFQPAQRGARACGGREGAGRGMPLMVPAGLPVPSHAELPHGRIVHLEKPDCSGMASPAHSACDPAACCVGEMEAWKAWLVGRSAVEIPAGESRRVLLDLREYHAAWPVVCASGTGAQLRLRFAESLFENLEGCSSHRRPKGNRDRWENKFFSGLGPDFFMDSKVREFRSYEWECGRWLEIRATAGAGSPLRLESLALRDAGYPFQDEGGFASDDPDIDALRAVCLRTLQVGTHGHYCDCPAYERLQYLGDARLEILSTYCLTRDRSLPRRALGDFAGARLSNGLLPSRFPASGCQVIPPFALYWIGMLHDAAMWGDRTNFSHLSVARGICDAWWQCRGMEGLVGDLPGWNFVDWVDEDWEAGMPPAADEGMSSILNWHFVWALRQLAELENWRGEHAMAAIQSSRAEMVVKALDALCWDEVAGLYRDSPGSETFSEHAQVFALLAGLPADRRRRVGEALASGNGLARATIYFTHYLFEAFRLLGRGDLLWQRLGLWFNLSDLGLKTTPEQPEPSRSDCHPWGTHPLYHMVASLAGIRPVAAGFSKIEVRPLENIPLRRMEVHLPHPHGTIHATLQRADTRRSWAGTLQAPPGVEVFAAPGIRCI